MTSPIKFSFKTEILPILIILVSFFASFYFYAHFPERVPTHWNFKGEVNGWSSRAFGAFFLPLLLLGMYIMFIVLPSLDPKKERYEQFSKVYNIFRTAIMLILALIYFIAGANGLGYNLEVGLWTPILIGLLFIVLGNYMGKLKMNWFVGIRTPWTLSSEEVWNKSHRFGGKVFMISGLIMAASAFLPANWIMPIFVANMILIVFGTLIYSYFVYLKYGKNNGDNNKPTQS